MTADIWNDSKTLSGLIGRHLSVTGCSGQQTYKGVLISADPVSRSFVLVKKSVSNGGLVNQTTVDSLSDNKAKLDYQIQVVPWVRQDNIILDEDALDGNVSNERIIDSSNFKKQFLSALSYPNGSRYILGNNSEDNTDRKNSAKDNLQSHQLDVTEGEDQKLIVEDLVTIRAPYTAFNCEGTNQIVLDRIRNLINQLDSNQGQ